MSFLILILSVDMETGNFGSKHVLRYYITKIIKILKKKKMQLHSGVQGFKLWFHCDPGHCGQM